MPMGKYETTIEIKSKKFTNNVNEVLDNLFWRKDMQEKKVNPNTGKVEYMPSATPHSVLALNMLNMIKQRRLVPRKYKDNIKELNTTQNAYYNILKKLTKAGMIYFLDGEYHISDAFAIRMDEYSRHWRTFKESI